MATTKKVSAKQIEEIVKEEELTLTAEEITRGIVAISEGIKSLSRTRLKPHLIHRLIAWSSGISIDKITKVLAAIETLETTYLKK